jgi:hypothetical protein
MIYPSKRQLPPCPDPELYQVIKAEGGYFWRRKRGTVTKAIVNKSFTEQINAVKITAPAASRILRLLESYTRLLQMGRITMRLSAQLRKGLTKGKINFNSLLHFEFLKEYPLDRILTVDYTIAQKKDSLQITIPLKDAVKKQNNLVTHFYFDAILVYGNMLEDNSLRYFDASSSPYLFTQKKETLCTLTIPLPKAEIAWFLLLKVGCIEGNEMAYHTKHYAMKVVKVSEV